jgi:hypothetical protein
MESLGLFLSLGAKEAYSCLNAPQPRAPRRRCRWSSQALRVQLRYSFKGPSWRCERNWLRWVAGVVAIVEFGWWGR